MLFFLRCLLGRWAQARVLGHGTRGRGPHQFLPLLEHLGGDIAWRSSRPLQRPHEFRPALEYLEDRCLLATVVWTGQAGGGNLNWGTGANWQGGAIPGPNDDVVFNATLGNSVVNQNFTVASLEVQAGISTTITLVGDLTIAPAGIGKASTFAAENATLTGAGKLILKPGITMTMSAGTMDGIGTTVVEAKADPIPAASLILGGTAIKTIGRPIENRGWLRWSDGNVVLKTNATITNFANATFHITAVGRTMTNGDNSIVSITNQMVSTMSVTIDPTKGTLITITDVKLFNHGKVNVLGPGTFKIEANTENSQTYDLGTGTILDLPGALQEHTWANATVQGVGKVKLGSILTVVGASSVSNLEDTSDAVITGSGNLTVTGTYTWAGSAWDGTGKVIIDQNATLDASFANGTNSSRTLENSGTVIWAPAGALSMIGTGAITNNASGVFDIRTNQGIGQAALGTGVFTNKGTTKKSAGAGGKFTLAMPFRNEVVGILHVMVGTVALEKSATQAQGATRLDTGTGLEVVEGMIFNNGSLDALGDAGIVGNVTINGPTRVQPASTATLSVTGDYLMTGGEFVVLIDVNAGTYSQLSVTGTVTLQAGGANAGKLSVSLVNNPPPGGTLYDIITYSSLVGDFAIKPTPGFQTLPGATVYQIRAGMGGMGLQAREAPDQAAEPGGPLTLAVLRPLVEEAIARWHAALPGDTSLGRLHDAEVRVADLPGSYLGFASPGLVQIDADAAGYGWFIDPTPRDDSEFSTPEELRTPGGTTEGAIDLLTVLLHEFGHVLGFDDLDPGLVPHHIMTGDLATGTRRLPTAGTAAAVSPPPDGPTPPPQPTP
ncbi:MAG: hypothetical protein L0Z62_29300, partial [Gemmataceae bacterium]|nr:hypothetical protein [Gemmataceae bacterium]